MVTEMRRDLEVQACDERSAITDLRTEARALIRLPPVDLLAERVFQLRALAESQDVQSARTALQGYFQGSTTTTHGDGLVYVAHGDFMPLALLTDKTRTPSELVLGGRCSRLVARVGFEPTTFGL